MLQTYRIIHSTIALCEQDGRQLITTIPAGSVVGLEDSVGDEKLVPVVWEDRKVFMFIQDLRAKSEPVTTAKRRRGA